MDNELKRLKKTAVQIRRDIIEATSHGKGGGIHVGPALSSVDLVTALYFKIMTVNPENPEWMQRDRFILSKGHAYAVWYSALAEKGFFPREELLTMRAINSRLQGHPAFRKTPGVDMTSGSLGNGLACGMGIAMAMKKNGVILSEGGVTPLLEKRLFALFDAAATTQPDIIVSTCSSIGETTRKYAAMHPELRMMSIDEPMARYAATHGKKVAVLATLATTVEPSAKLVSCFSAEAGRDVSVVSAVAGGAFDAMRSGDMAHAAELVVQTAKAVCSDADIILLAQASMANFRQALHEALGCGVTLLESPSTCAQYLKTELGC